MTRQSRTNSTNKLAEEKIPRLFFQLTLPAVFAQLVNMLYNMVDRMYISRIPQVGQIALTGVGVSMPLIVLVSAFANLVGSGGSPLAANALGAKKTKEANAILHTAFRLSLLLGVLLPVLFLPFLSPLLRLVGASSDSLPYARAYGRIYPLDFRLPDGGGRGRLGDHPVTVLVGGLGSPLSLSKGGAPPQRKRKKIHARPCQADLCPRLLPVYHDLHGESVTDRLQPLSPSLWRGPLRGHHVH